MIEFVVPILTVVLCGALTDNLTVRWPGPMLAIAGDWRGLRADDIIKELS